MTRTVATTIVLFFSGVTALYAASFGPLSGEVTGGYAAAAPQSPALKVTASIGQNYNGYAEKGSYRNYGGFAPSLVQIVDGSVAFLDESPTASDWQDSTRVTCRIRVKITGGNTISDVKYHLSNSGPANFNAGWEGAVSCEQVLLSTTSGAQDAIYRIDIPNASSQTFSMSESNYIQWWVQNDAGDWAVSSAYRIRVRTNDPPAITILQPDDRVNASGTRPLIQVRIADQYGGVDENSIVLRMDANDGTNVCVIRSSETPSIFNASQHLVNYQYNGAPLRENGVYRLTISASDKNASVSSSSATGTFTVRGGAIADIVPYPSPFDPKVQPVRIRYALNKRSNVSINIYDMSGRLVRNVVNEQSRDAGTSEDTWQGINLAGDELANGVYFCEIVARDEDGEHRRYTPLAIFGK